jgi:hypothetical protein
MGSENERIATLAIDAGIPKAVALARFHVDTTQVNEAGRLSIARVLRRTEPWDRWGAWANHEHRAAARIYANMAEMAEAPRGVVSCYDPMDMLGGGHGPRLAQIEARAAFGLVRRELGRELRAVDDLVLRGVPPYRMNGLKPWAARSASIRAISHLVNVLRGKR